MSSICGACGLITVAFLVHSLRTGGIERSVTRIVNGLNTKLFRPVIICLDRSGPAANWLEVDVDIIEIKKRSGNDFRAVRRLAKVLATQKADILQSHNWGTLMEGGGSATVGQYAVSHPCRARHCTRSGGTGWCEALDSCGRNGPRAQTR